MFSPFSSHHISRHSSSSSKSDESDDDVDTRNGRKIYNLTDILSTPSSGFYKYEPREQKPPPYEQLHYKPSSASDEKPKTKERYYIYSHIKSANDDAYEMNRSDSSRKARSSPLSDRKQVSRNISMVLENLLMSYENSQLPTHGQGSQLHFLMTFKAGSSYGFFISRLILKRRHFLTQSFSIRQTTIGFQLTNRLIKRLKRGMKNS